MSPIRTSRERSLLLALLLTPWLAAAQAVGLAAETITVGPTANGCDQPSLALAFIRAAVTAESDTILFSEDQTWTGSGALLLSGEAPVTLAGVRSCSDFAITQRTITTTVSDLFEFSDTQATFRKLRLLGDTGGRLLTGTGTSILTLDETLVLRGRANEGGNVHLSGGASLLALAGSAIFQGEATFDGGGVFCTGGGVVGLGEESRLYDNRAGFNGGGVYVDGCALNVLAGGPGPPGISRYGIYGNRAEFNGGGVYARGGSRVLLSGHGMRPGSIVRNDAVGLGGGLYLTGLGTIADVYNSEIADNRAFDDGGGVYLTSQANLLMDRTVADCDRGVRCSLLAGNSAGLSSPNVSEGGALVVRGGADAFVRQTYVTDNFGEDGGHVAVVSGGGSFLLVENSALFDNGRLGVHVEARDGGWARLAFVSAWGSSEPGIGMGLVEAGANGRVSLLSSLVVEGQGLAIGGGGPDRVFQPAGPGGFYTIDCVILHETASAGGTHPVVTDPALVWQNPAAGDPHLLATAQAIDYCDALAYAPMDDDLDGEPRGTDVPSNFDELGPYDLGADEWNPPPPDPGAIFSDGFESGNVGAWSSSVP